jgi:hypothetical protein
MKMLFAVVVLMLLACHSAQCAAPPVPSLPISFTADVSITSSLLPLAVTGKFYYDYSALSQRIDQSAFGQSSTTLDRYDQGLQYQVNVLAASPVSDLRPVRCQSLPMRQGKQHHSQLCYSPWCRLRGSCILLAIFTVLID